MDSAWSDLKNTTLVSLSETLTRSIFWLQSARHGPLRLSNGFDAQRDVDAINRLLLTSLSSEGVVTNEHRYPHGRPSRSNFPKTLQGQQHNPDVLVPVRAICWNSESRSENSHPSETVWLGSWPCLLDLIGSWSILASHQTFEADRCVDIFSRPNGTFGFEEFRRDPEDMGAWTPIGYFRDTNTRPRRTPSGLLIGSSSGSARSWTADSAIDNVV